MHDFPIVCHTKLNHLHDELMVNHLTDANVPEQTFRFTDLRFITYLGLSRIQAESRIAFLAASLESGDLSVVLIRHDKSYEKKNRMDLDKWQIQKFNLT